MNGICPRCGSKAEIEVIEDAECQEVDTLLTWPVTITTYTCRTCYTVFQEGGCEWLENAPEGG